MHSVTRLYTQFHPHHYDIHWDLTHTKSERTVRGTTSIRGEQRDEHDIRLHVHGLVINRVRVDGTRVTDFSIDAALDELRIPHLGRGSVTIDIEFELKMTDAMHGIYPCYFAHDGKKQELYATQFESHHAREAFPCIDEPEAKATFSVSLTHPLHLTALSNMPVSTQDARDKALLTAFDVSPIMSTYLVAFVVGELQRATTTSKTGVEVNVYATKVHASTALSYALDHAARTIDFFSEYFDVPYPLPKSDHVALPDFSSGAMENWGLVTYREIALLADPKTISVSGKQYITEVVAHELSHQWFGNLVTMKWWDNLWLNESFATTMEYLAADALHPEWNSWFDFATNEGVIALRRDCIDGVQPVQVAVHHPDEITSLFDGAIVYAKGGRLLRMMQAWIGEDAFRAGLKSYFIAHQYDNTTGDDLWRSLSTASRKDVGKLMNTWIKQGGYPVVHASLVDSQLSLRQEQFFVGPHQDSDKLWPIPLHANRPGIPDLFETRELHTPFSRNEMLYLNSENTGHFITHYDDTLRHRILSSLADGELTDIQRAQFLNEQMLLARGGYISSALLLDLLPLYASEQSEKVWDTMALTISDLKRFVETDEVAEHHLKQYVAVLARPQYQRLGLDVKDGESEDDTKLRATIISCMVYGEDTDVIYELCARYDTSSLEDLDPELRNIIIGAAVRSSDDDHIIKSLVTAYRASISAELRADITAGLSSTRREADITYLLSLLKDDDTVRRQDLMQWYVALLRNKHGRTAAWKWLRDEWAWIESTFDGDKSYDYFPRYAATFLTTRTQLDEYREFFTTLRADPALTRTIDMGVLDLEGRIDLLERDTPAVIDALRQL